jgi:hypothetical protein
VCSGKLPNDLPSAANLEVLGFGCNAFIGTLKMLASLTKLTKVAVDCNLFTGPLPSLIKSKASLTSMSVANNKLAGPISADYAMMSKMTTFGVAFKIITALPQLTVSALCALLNVCIGVMLTTCLVCAITSSGHLRQGKQLFRRAAPARSGCCCI